MSPPAVALNFKPFEKNTLRGFFDLELASGLILRGCSLHKKTGGSGLACPAVHIPRRTAHKASQTSLIFPQGAAREVSSAGARRGACSVSAKRKGPRLMRARAVRRQYA
jgi:hypothetical protein